MCECYITGENEMKEQELVGWGWADVSTTQYWPNLFRRYRINNQDFEAMWKRQEGKCGGCKGALAHPIIRKLDTGLKPEIDHDHATAADLQQGQKSHKKDVRGLLCRRCNDFLGKLQDNMDTLQGLLEYLAAHKEHHGNSK